MLRYFICHQENGCHGQASVLHGPFLKDTLQVHFCQAALIKSQLGRMEVSGEALAAGKRHCTGG